MDFWMLQKILRLRILLPQWWKELKNKRLDVGTDLQDSPGRSGQLVGHSTCPQRLFESPSAGLKIWWTCLCLQWSDLGWTFPFIAFPPFFLGELGLDSFLSSSTICPQSSFVLDYSLSLPWIVLYYFLRIFWLPGQVEIALRAEVLLKIVVQSSPNSAQRWAWKGLLGGLDLLPHSATQVPKGHFLLLFKKKGGGALLRCFSV